MTRSSASDSLKSQCTGLTADQLMRIEFLRSILCAVRDDGAIAGECFIDEHGRPHVSAEWPEPYCPDESEEAR